jgi:hypothetical protein
VVSSRLVQVTYPSLYLQAGASGSFGKNSGASGFSSGDFETPRFLDVGSFGAGGILGVEVAAVDFLGVAFDDSSFLGGISTMQLV